MNNASPWTHLLLISAGVMSWRSLVFCCLPCSRSAIRAKRVGCLLVVKVVFVVFPNSAGIVSPQALCIVVYLAAGGIGNSTNPITRFSGRTKKMMGDGTHSIPHQGVMTVLISSSFLLTVDQSAFSTLRRRIGRPPGPPGCGGTSTTDKPWNSRWRKPHPDKRCWRRLVREDRCKYLLSYPLR